MNIKIRKISFDFTNYYELNGCINLKNRSISFSLSADDYHHIFGESELDVNLLKKCYILGDDSRYYSCFNCIFSYSFLSETFNFLTTSIDLIIEDYLIYDEKFTITELTFCTYYLNQPLFSAYVLDNHIIEYSPSIRIIINSCKSGKNSSINITVKSKTSTTYKNLSKIGFTIFEMITLFLGYSPIIEIINAKCGDRSLRINNIIVNKYDSLIVGRTGNEILFPVDKNTLNKKTIKEFQFFRKETDIAYDIFLLTINSNQYLEIKNCNLVQIIEGLYRKIMNVKGRIVLYDALKYFFDYKELKPLIQRRDKRKLNNHDNQLIFLHKAKNHRHFISHIILDHKEIVFYKKENIYAYWKLCMAIRIIVIKNYISIPIDLEKVKKYSSIIDKWVKDKKMRLSVKSPR